MPFKSKVQAAWMYANKPKMAKEWASKTPGIKELPKKVYPVKGKKVRMSDRMNKIIKGE